jgi:hypothetical protein
MKIALSIQLAHLIAHVLIAANIFALVVGLLMLTMPHRLEALFKVSDRWVSTKRTFEPLDLMHDADRHVMRYPRLLGGLLVVGAVFILIRGGLFAAKMSALEGGRLLARVFGAKLPPAAWEVLWVSLVALLLLGALLALAVGILSFYRRETLARWSAYANRWVATHHLFDPLDTPNYTLNKIVHEKSRLWGALITALALAALVALFWYLRR